MRCDSDDGDGCDRGDDSDNGVGGVCLETFAYDVMHERFDGHEQEAGECDNQRRCSNVWGASNNDKCDDELGVLLNRDGLACDVSTL